MYYLETIVKHGYASFMDMCIRVPLVHKISEFFERRSNLYSTMSKNKLSGQ